MIAGLPPYPEYKQSVLEQVPTHKGNSRIKTVLRKLDYRSTEGSRAKGDSTNVMNSMNIGEV
jgi:hypothetical protein